MTEATITMEQVDAMRQFLDDQQLPPAPFVLVLHPQFSFDLARELDECSVFTCEVHEDGVRVICIVDVPRPEALTFEQREMLALASGLRFMEMPVLSPLPPALRRDPAQHMAELRRKTGQDWRGRR